MEKKQKTAKCCVAIHVGLFCPTTDFPDNIKGPEMISSKQGPFKAPMPGRDTQNTQMDVSETNAGSLVFRGFCMDLK